MFRTGQANAAIDWTIRESEKAIKGWELVQATARLCAMNMLLHGIGSQMTVAPPAREEPPSRPPGGPSRSWGGPANGLSERIVVNDSLAVDPGDRFDMVLTNPPFGKRRSTTRLDMRWTTPHS